MTRVLNVSESDYRLKVQSGGTITLDTGVSPGVVVITGDLDVKGTTTTIESVNTTVKDNILQLNYGQTGNGISGALNYVSGLQIVRGTNQSSYPNAELVFDEQTSHYDPLTDDTIDGTFVFRYFNSTTLATAGLTGIQVSSIGTTPGADLAFDMQGGSSVLKVVNPLDYSSSVFAGGDDTIPNKKYISDYVAASGGSGSGGGMADVDNFHYMLAPFQTRGQAYSNNIQFTVMNALRAQITQTGLNVDKVNTFQNEIKTLAATAANLKLSADTNTVEINAVLQIDNVSGPTAVSSATKIYAQNSDTTPGPGKTGIYFTNLGNSDELVSKNRAVLFSMLF